MATRYLTRSILTTAVLHRSYATAAGLPNSSSSFLLRLRPLIAAASYYRHLSPAFSTRGFSTRQTSSSLNDPNPNWSNRPPKETILLDGCDFEHWLVVLEKPEGDPTRDEIIDSYIKTLAMVVGSEEEARTKIYSVSTRHYFAFGALVSEDLSYKIKELPKVRWVLPDSYLDVKNKDYGGEPFINGQAVPYDPKYHEEWVRNNARANERNRRNDRPRNFDRSRNFERRRDNMQMGNQNSGPNMGGPGGNMGGPPPPNTGALPPSTGPMQPHMSVPPNNYPGNNMRGMPNNAPNYQYGNGPNQSGFAPSAGPGQGQNQHGYAPNTAPNSFTPNRGFGPGQTSNSLAPNAGYGNGQHQNNYGPNMGPPGPGANQTGYPPNMGQNQNGYAPPNMGQNQNSYAPPNMGQNQNSYAPPDMSGGNPYQNQNVAERDLPPRPNY